MLRKHFNNTDKEEMNKLPFYSWNCITLQMKHRDVDLVIRNESDMEKVIKFLIYNLKTVDGAKNSALKLIKIVREDKLSQLSRCPIRGSIDPFKEIILNQQVEWEIYNKVYFKYKILKFRHKLSYQAFVKHMTICEILMRGILNTYTVSDAEGTLEMCTGTMYAHHKISLEK